MACYPVIMFPGYGAGDNHLMAHIDSLFGPACSNARPLRLFHIQISNAHHPHSWDGPGLV